MGQEPLREPPLRWPPFDPEEALSLLSLSDSWPVITRIPARKSPEVTSVNEPLVSPVVIWMARGCPLSPRM
jgi:hypothetical protein